MAGREASRRCGNERGYLMAGLVVSIAIMAILSTTAFQAWDEVVRRDNEAEMIFRAQEIVRAIVKYRRDNGGLLPEKLEDLMEEGPRGQFYLRHLYEDPLVKDGKWGLLYGGPGGTIVDPAAPEESALDAEGGLGLRSLSSRDRRDRRQGKGAEPEPDPQQGEGQGQGGIGGLANPPGETGEVGGLRIAGVKSLCTDKPFRVYRGLTEYAEWLFTYLDIEAPQVPGQSAGAPGQPPVARPPGSPGEGGGFTAQPPRPRNPGRQRPDPLKRPGR